MCVGEYEDEEDGYISLAEVWDGLIIPQLTERFANRQERLIDFLRIEKAISESLNWYPYSIRRPTGYTSFEPSALLEKKRLLELDLEVIINTLRFLAYG